MAYIDSIFAAAGLGLSLAACAHSAWCLFRPCRHADNVPLVLLGATAMSLLALLSIHALETGRVPAFGSLEALSFYAVTVIAAHLYMAIRHQMHGLTAILSPYIAIVIVLAITTTGQAVDVPIDAGHLSVTLHVTAAFLAYAFCTTAGVLGVAYLIQDRNLKHKHFGATFQRLPTLELLDHQMARQIGGAFLMLTLAGAFGVHLVLLRGDAAEWATDPKIVATAITWGIYAVLMHMRTGGCRHGRGMAALTIMGLLFLLFSFLGIHLLANSVHHFVLPGEGAI
ncbi:MAG: cytochrome c biogenesis protein [Candidatus Marinimicrobia bacterium]|nr:cytochrome c biogenesis protein [Candidatus Neomarinimicrobiota bacterium]